MNSILCTLLIFVLLVEAGCAVSSVDSPNTYEARRPMSVDNPNTYEARRPMSVDNPNTYEARTLKKAEGGDADAQNWIGDMYRRHGNITLSEEWFRKAKASAIQQGNPFAQKLAQEALFGIDYGKAQSQFFNEQRAEREKAAEREAEEARQKQAVREWAARVQEEARVRAARVQEEARVRAAREQEEARKQAALYIKKASLYILLAIPVFVFLTIFIILKFNPELFNYFYPGLTERLSKLENAYALRYPNLPKP